eukprot:TRINITY_DN5856_c0_g1_i3.p1 TRINITY_DN5856_c0_g1~~TRINITY_DN5856_c0_g1_i3.p1  ORF type:complete len:610 (+),score=115.88 TRINITY_DN5856_c0_g1_i3:77-1906(+)
MDGAFDQRLFVYSDEVADAIAKKKPIVALESTIISHGMPYPENLYTAREVESIVRENGATPATIAIIDGLVHVGLNDSQLEQFAKLGLKAHKTSRRDIASVIANKQLGATTVSATMLVAHRAGIKVFVTGGIGGVHRGAQTTMDISADLTELGRTPVTVVCAGAKSLLDIGLTLEYLETQGVTVIGYKTSDFPAFYVPKSGYEAPLRADTPDQCAKLIDANHRLNLNSGLIVAVPIPEQYAATASVVEKAIQQALAEAEEKHVSGRDVTPFLLKRVSELTQGESLKSNISLIKNNAAVGSQIAKAYTDLTQSTESSASKSKNAVVIGGFIMDVLGQPDKGQKIAYRSSNTGPIGWRSGGVSRNVAEALHRCGTPTLFISTCGPDPAGKMLLDHFRKIGMPTRGVKEVSGERTCIFAGVLDEHGDLITAITDVDVFAHITTEYVLGSFGSDIKEAGLLVIDGNFPMKTTIDVVNFAHAHNVPVLFEPTSTPMSLKVIEGHILDKISFLTPAQTELEAMAEALGVKAKLLNEDHSINFTNVQEAIRTILSKGPKIVLAKFGPQGVVGGYKQADGSVSFLRQEAMPVKVSSKKIIIIIDIPSLPSSCFVLSM